MDFDSMKPAPKDRSIFRKNLGRALINRENSEYLKVWNLDFTTRKNREDYSHLRNIEYEKEIETKITDTLRNKFSFRYIEIKDEEMRIGEKGLERRLIGSLANYSQCTPSENWLGRYSPKPKIRKSGLWQVQHLKSSPITSQDMEKIKKICS
jgi:hypothetical protein